MNPVRINNYAIEANAPSRAIWKAMADANSAKWSEQPEPTLNDLSIIRDCSHPGESLFASRPINLVSPHISIPFLQCHFCAGTATTPACRFPYYIT